MDGLFADVVIVGGGLAGHVAAVTAVQSGASVLLLEKQPAVGGSSVMSGGLFAFAETDEQRERGIDDSLELLRSDLLAEAAPAGDASIIDRYVSEQLDVYKWMKSLGTRFTAVTQSAGQTLARSHLADPRALVAALGDLLRAAPNAQIRTGCTVHDLVVAHDRVVGVLANDTGARVNTQDMLDAAVASSSPATELVTARHGVVLASGGFSRSKHLLGLFAPRQLAAMPYGGLGNTGDGLVMAWKLGADMADLGYVSSSYGSHPETTIEQHELLSAYYKGAILVNLEGRRFVDESVSYKRLGDAALDEPDGLVFQVFDATVRARSQPGVPLSDIEALENKGRVLVGDTLTDLAASMAVPAAELAATVQAYNDAIHENHPDPFGRTGLVNGVGARTPIEHAPFYAYPAKSLMTTTFAGPRTDGDARVLRLNGSAIDGLFAAGELVGGFHGRSYMTGTALGKAAIFGRIAGSTVMSS